MRIISDEKVSQAQIAKEAGISGAALSGFLKGSYAGDLQAIEKKISMWMETRKRNAERVGYLPPPPEFLPLPTSQKITSVLEYPHAANDFAVIYGVAGVSKTATLKNYSENNPNVWIATMTPGHSGVSACLEEIAISIGMHNVAGRSARMFRDIVRRIKGTQGLIIIDEAQHLSPAALEMIRSLHDAAGIGVVLSGNEAVYSRLTGGVKSSIFAQLFSRVGKRLKLTRPVKDDVVGIANAFGVTGSKEINALWEIGKKPGALRGVVKTLRLAFLFASGADRPVDVSFIWAAWTDLSGETCRME
jgi:DNA transposition AAA+ family ATPase